MNKLTETIFRYKRAVLNKLPAYGFIMEESGYVYRTEICGNQMLLTVSINARGEIDTQVVDTETDEPYTLFLVDGAEGEFVGRVRAEYVSALEDISEKCFESKVFSSAQAEVFLSYAREKYGDEPEFLWDDLPKTGVWRRKDTKKWYAVLMTIPRKKLGLFSDELVEVVNVHIEPEELDRIADGKKYFRGYHMNKKHWLTFCLDGTLTDEEIFALTDKSYALAKK